MGKLKNDGMFKVSWLPSVANYASPTVAELNAGVSLELQVTPTGLVTKPTTGDVETSALASDFDTAEPGRASFELSVEFMRLDGYDPAYNALYFRAAGVLAVRRTVATATAWASGQTVEIYPAMCKRPEPSTPAKNEVQKYMVAMTLTDDPEERATVA